jgi:hypothetical protein
VGSSGDHGIAIFRVGRVALITRASHVSRVAAALDEIIYTVHNTMDNDDDWNPPTTKLLTLLNVSSAKSLKRKFLGQQGSPPHKLNKRRVSDRDSSNSAVEVNIDAEGVEHEASQAGREINSPDDVGTGEAADLSDAEGVIHLWPRGSCCLTINRERVYVRAALWSRTALSRSICN